MTFTEICNELRALNKTTEAVALERAIIREVKLRTNGSTPTRTANAFKTMHASMKEQFAQVVSAFDLSAPFDAYKALQDSLYSAAYAVAKILFEEKPKLVRLSAIKAIHNKVNKCP